ncbi:Zinc finger RING-type [Arabidopsis suecica]|uniref:RING-type E3 ubiquitin transferase n=1 Tax=Arabidopsis suecica TaxID=45249 RepID=A0A8T2HEK6_ARASU|nr:Zinc finger RING-type [Arabidopsis suecica]
MEEAVVTRYWCHMCSQTVNPVMEAEIKCPFCQSGFVEEMEDDDDHDSSDPADVRANNSLWAPILMELMNDPVRRRRNQSVESVEDNQNEVQTENNEYDGENDLDWQLQEILRRRRRHSAAVLQLLQGIRAGLSVESESTGNGGNNPGRVILINTSNQTITVQNSADMDSVPAGSLGDYFIGPGFEMLLQRLAENDPNRYGTPPAKKEAVEALATVKIEETLQCSVCLDDFEIGTEAKLMPCTHKFHSDCLLPWLELHSSCPVCRYQLPADEAKTDSVTTTSDNNGSSSASATTSHGAENSDGNRRQEEEEEEEEEEENENNDGSGFSIPWPFSTLFSSSQDSNAPTDSS